LLNSLAGWFKKCVFCCVRLLSKGPVLVTVKIKENKVIILLSNWHDLISNQDVHFFQSSNC
jgi:hypothetical protein